MTATWSSLGEVKIANAVHMTSEQERTLAEPGPEGPIVMVNLLKFREHALYADGSDSHLSGREVYQRYGAAIGKLIRDYGGRFLFAGDVTSLMIGQVGDMWDEIALAEYPDRAALHAMISSPECRAVAHHREAGLAGQLNIEATWLPVFRRGL